MVTVDSLNAKEAVQLWSCFAVFLFGLGCAGAALGVSTELSISSDTELAFCYSPFCFHSLDQDAKQIIKLSIGFPVSLHY